MTEHMTANVGNVLQQIQITMKSRVRKHEPGQTSSVNGIVKLTGG